MRKRKKTLVKLVRVGIIKLVFQKIKESSDDGKEATPVPIPNTEVKLFCADGSWGFPPVRVGRCQADPYYSEVAQW